VQSLSKPRTGVFTETRQLLAPGNIRIIAFSSVLTGSYLLALNTFLQYFVVIYLGFSGTILGALVAIGARPSGLASSIIQPFAGHLADILGRKKLMLLGSAVGVCSMASFAFAALTRNILPLSMGYFLLGLSLLGNPASQAMVAETVAMDPDRMNIAYSVLFFFTSLPGVIVPFLVNYFVSSVGYAVIFAVAAILEATNLLVLFPRLRETHSLPQAGDGIRTARRFSFRESVRIPRSLIRIFVPFAMDAFSFGVGGSIVYGMWAKSFGFSLEELSLIYGVFAVSIVVSQYFATRLLLAMGTRRTLAFSEFLTVVVLLGWLLVPQLLPLLVISVVFGFSVDTWVPAVSSVLMAAAPVEERGSVGGKLAFIRGLIGAPAPVLAGLIYSAYGYYVPIFLSLVGESITTVALLKLLPEPNRAPHP
jgi:MFS family permease